MTVQRPVDGRGLRTPELIARVPFPDESTFQREWLHSEQPVVFTGYPFHQRFSWTPEALVERFGELTVTAYRMQGAQVSFDPRTGLIPESVTLREFATNSTGRRLRCTLDEKLSALSSLAEIPPLCAGKSGLRGTLWWSPTQTITPLHLDLPHNLLVHLYGEKRFLLFSPKDTWRLYPCAPWSSTPQFSRIDLSSPAYESFPLLLRATPYEAVLEPGDCLFMPSRWWHFSRSYTETLSIAWWWTPDNIAPLLRMVEVFKRVRGLTR